MSINVGEFIEKVKEIVEGIGRFLLILVSRIVKDFQSNPSVSGMKFKVMSSYNFDSRTFILPIKG